MMNPDEKQVRSILKKYSCPIQYHQVRTLFLGNIAIRKASASPISVAKGLWGGQLPVFPTVEAGNELLDILVNRLWNSLTRHKKPSEPFQLVRTPAEPTRAGISAYVLMRCEEVDGFVEGLLNGQDDVYLPEKADTSIEVMGELRTMLGAVHAIATCDTKVSTDRRFVEFSGMLKQLDELTSRVEHEINTVVLSCTRSHRQRLNVFDFSAPTFH